MDQGQYYPGQPLPVAYGIPSGLPSAKSEEDRLREEVARLKSENAELRGEDDEELAPLGGGPPKKRGRPAKDDGQRPKKGGRPPKWALSEGQKPPAGGDDAPKGKGTHSRRPKKAEGAKEPRGAPYVRSTTACPRLRPRRTRGRRATNPGVLGGDGKYKSIGLFPTEKEAAMAVDDYLYKTFPEKYAAFRANFPRNADGTCGPGVPGPPPGGPPL